VSSIVPPIELRLERARQWFLAQSRTPFEFQEAMWSAYWRGESGLLNAGTGTGKTLAAWLGPLLESPPDARVERHAIQVIWLTPLRALARDLVAALREPLEGLASDWRVEERTGDTSSSIRARQTRKPPQALVTTPESLSVMLSRADMLPALRDVKALIVDEWHEFLGTKRGVQLELGAAALAVACAAYLGHVCHAAGPVAGHAHAARAVADGHPDLFNGAETL
jgi:ATP-dependent helicase Lhr and Lhr-like helicase